MTVSECEQHCGQNIYLVKLILGGKAFGDSINEVGEGERFTTVPGREKNQ